MAATNPTDPWILVLGTADWNQAIATNQHYMVRELAKAHRLTFVESLGLRRPELSARDIARISMRVKRVVRPAHEVDQRAPRPIPPSVDVVSPIVLPYHAGLPRMVNRPLVARAVRAWASYLGPKVLWTYSPVTYGLEKVADTVVYHCVDLLGEFPGISSAMIDANADRLAQVPVTAIASSAVVATELTRQGFYPVTLWPNVADVEAIRMASPPDGRQERAVFAGNLSASKVDFGLLHKLLDLGISLDLAGPIAEGGGDSARAVEQLVGAGATYHGLLSLDELGTLYSGSTVGLIPYLLNPYTTGVNPLKTYEYLAAGLTVVSTPVPAVLRVDGDVFVERDAKEFTERVLSVIQLPAKEAIDRRMALSEHHSWSGRGIEARSLIERMVPSTV